MIVKTSKGYVVKSESGKTLSKPYQTKEQAQNRLRDRLLEKQKGQLNALFFISPLITISTFPFA